MKDGHTTHGESSFGKKLGCVLIVLFLGSIGWQMWKNHSYNNAVREAKEAGFEWRCEDTISLIRQDWRNALKKETWGEHPRLLDMSAREVRDLGRYREMLHHLRPKVLYINGCENVDSLNDLTSLRVLSLYDCAALQNVDSLKALTGLQILGINGCIALKNVDALKSLTALQTLNLWNCPALQNVDVLKGLNGLQYLDLENCTALQNVDVLKGLTGLKELALIRCSALQNTDGFKGLTDLHECPAVTTTVVIGCNLVVSKA